MSWLDHLVTIHAKGIETSTTRILRISFTYKSSPAVILGAFTTTRPLWLSGSRARTVATATVLRNGFVNTNNAFMTSTFERALRQVVFQRRHHTGQQTPMGLRCFSTIFDGQCTLDRFTHSTGTSPARRDSPLSQSAPSSAFHSAESRGIGDVPRMQMLSKISPSTSASPEL